MRTKTMILIAAATLPTAAAAAEPLNIFWIGNSHTRWAASTGTGFNQGQTPGVADLVGKFAVAAGFDAPNHHWDVVNGAFLGPRASNVDNIINNGIPAGTTIDVLVMQGNSTESIAELGGNAANFGQAASTIESAFRGHNAALETVLYQTWARAADHPNYAANGGPVANPQAWHEQNAASYAAANDLINSNGGDARTARVGDGMAATDWSSTYISGDDNHFNREGGVLASVIMFEAIYGVRVGDLDINLNQFDDPIELTLRGLGINVAEFEAIIAIADSVPVVPAPGTAAFAASGLLFAARRRRA